MMRRHFSAKQPLIRDPEFATSSKEEFGDDLVLPSFPINFPIPLWNVALTTAHDIVANTLNCLQTAPCFEAIEELKKDDNYNHHDWEMIKGMDKATFEYLRRVVVRRKEEFVGPNSGSKNAVEPSSPSENGPRLKFA